MPNPGWIENLTVWLAIGPHPVGACAPTLPFCSGQNTSELALRRSLSRYGGPVSQPSDSVPALSAPPIGRDNPLTRSKAGLVGIGFLVLMLALCAGTLPWTLREGGERGVARYNEG